MASFRIADFWSPLKIEAVIPPFIKVAKYVILLGINPRPFSPFLVPEGMYALSYFPLSK